MTATASRRRRPATVPRSNFCRHRQLPFYNRAGNAADYIWPLVPHAGCRYISRFQLQLRSGFPTVAPYILMHRSKTLRGRHKAYDALWNFRPIMSLRTSEAPPAMRATRASTHARPIPYSAL